MAGGAGRQVIANPVEGGAVGGRPQNIAGVQKLTGQGQFGGVEKGRRAVGHFGGKTVHGLSLALVQAQRALHRGDDLRRL